jgi:hypothetical protein
MVRRQGRPGGGAAKRRSREGVCPRGAGTEWAGRAASGRGRLGPRKHACAAAFLRHRMRAAELWAHTFLTSVSPAATLRASRNAAEDARRLPRRFCGGRRAPERAFARAADDPPAADGAPTRSGGTLRAQRRSRRGRTSWEVEGRKPRAGCEPASGHLKPGAGPARHGGREPQMVGVRVWFRSGADSRDGTPGHDGVHSLTVDTSVLRGLRREGLGESELGQSRGRSWQFLRTVATRQRCVHGRW